MPTCKSCEEDIRWVDTVNGKKMPVNEPGILVAVPDPDGGLYRIVTGYVPHWATCPNANDHRRKGVA